MLAKLLLMNAACDLAAGVISNRPDTLPLDAEINDPAVKAENLMAFRLAHVFYDGLARALDPKTGWQTPAFDPSIQLPDLAGGAPLLSRLAELAKNLGVAPDLVGVLGKLVEAIPTPPPASPPAGPIPSPADSVK